VSSSQQTDPMIGRLVDGRYRVRARIARGGMATVYVATDLRLERRVALKVMHAHLSDDSVFQSRFIQEARSAARLADPHVVNVFDQGQDRDMAYLVMEYLPGITLRELLREQKKLSVQQTVTIMDAILGGLAAAHRAGIVHRDVKPENVLLAEDGRIKIGDFGLARATTANTATGQMLLGTIAYLAPELVTRGQADARSDIYALGIMLYEMLTGEQPFKGEQPMQIAYQHATDKVPRPSARASGIPEELDELVLWATEREPDDRPIDAQAMLDRLREIERALGVTPLNRGVGSTAGVPIVEDYHSGDVTRVLPGGMVDPATAPVAAALDNSGRLRQRTRRRAGRGAALLVLVLLLAAAAGTVGWWFGSGPGSLISVPDVAGSSYDDAATMLDEAGLTPIRVDASDYDVPAGTVIRTDPETGIRLERAAEVSVVVSTGPAMHTVPALVGMPATTANGTLQADRIIVTEPMLEEFSDAETGTVIAATRTPRAGGEPVGFGDGGDAYEGDEVTLTVSLGPVPAVAGDTIEAATAKLRSVGLEVASERTEVFSDTVRADLVIELAPRDGGGNWRPADAVTLVVSKGPQPFPIPDVKGMTRDQAKRALEAQGFKASWAVFWGAIPNDLTRVASMDPGAGTERPKGTEVYLQLTASG